MGERRGGAPRSRPSVLSSFLYETVPKLAQFGCPVLVYLYDAGDQLEVLDELDHAAADGHGEGGVVNPVPTLVDVERVAYEDEDGMDLLG